MTHKGKTCLIFLVAILSSLSAAKDFRVSVISDMHVDMKYDPQVSADLYCTRGEKRDQVPAPYGRHGCDSPYVLFASAVMKMKEAEPSPDLILVPGDFVTHSLIYKRADKEFNETRYQEIMDTVENVAQSIAREFPGSPIVFTQGNGDYLYNYQVPDQTRKARHYSALYYYWIANIPSNKKAATAENFFSMREHGGYVQEIRKDLVVISFNSNYYTVHNRVENDPGIPKSLFRWLESQLLLAQSKHQKVILLYHIPHGTYTAPVSRPSFWVEEYKAEMYRLLQRYNDTVSMSFTGHLHHFNIQSADQARLQAEFNYNSLVVMRAVSPIRVNNPGFSVFTYTSHGDERLMHPAYYDEYTFLLSHTVGTTEDPQRFWVHLYNSRQDLGLEDLSPAGIGRFIASLVQDPKRLVRYTMYKIGEPFSEDKAKWVAQVCGRLFPTDIGRCVLGLFTRFLPRYGVEEIDDGVR